jgi:hypothetical protein
VTGRTDEMHVSWATSGACSGNGQVAYAPAGAPAAALQVVATCKVFDLNQTTPLGLWEGVMTALKPATKYTYTLDGAFTGSFTNQPAGVRTYAAYGDLGFADDFAVPQLIVEAQAGLFDMVIHAGDSALRGVARVKATGRDSRLPGSEHTCTGARYTPSTLTTLSNCSGVQSRDDRRQGEAAVLEGGP